jgi:Amino acid permease
MGEYTKVVIGQTTEDVPNPILLGLKTRHLQLIGIGGAIGAGFFIGSGVAISQAGPALLIAYILTGAVMFLMMRALGEMTLAYPAAGSFSSYATQFIGPLAGFVTGWSYWLACLLVGIAEMTGVGLLPHRWFPHLPQWIPALCAALLLYGINMRGVRFLGETEYWLTMIKGGDDRCRIAMRSRDPVFQDRKSAKSGRHIQSLGAWRHFAEWFARTSHCAATRHFFLWRNRINRSRFSRDRTAGVRAAPCHQ